ncbi:MAG: VWA domain-containing protein [Planctomycetes bacterium]|nr:VWA domain-containing protein [Planctomycetota bacterium]
MFQFLSMGWLYAAPLLIGGLVLLYFLKLKRREVGISSTYLWQNALNDLRVNSPFQRLRTNLLLILQLLALILIILALSRPVSPLGGMRGSDAILLIDVSASMSAEDANGQTRFLHAKQEALKVIDDMSFGDKAVIVAFDDEAQVLTDMTESKSTLRRALEKLEPTDRGSQLGGALQRVRSLLGNAERAPELYVFSDGRVGSLDNVSLDESVPLHFIRCGSSAENVGIVSFDVHLASGFGDETRVFVSVQNLGTEERTVGVDFYLDGDLAGSREVKLGPEGVTSVAFDAPLQDEPRHVRITLDHGTDASTDVLASDDEVVAILKPPMPFEVLLVSDGNLFLHSALSEDPRVAKTAEGTVPTIASANFKPEFGGEFDVVVLDRVTPPTIGAGNYLCFGARPPFPGLTDLGQMEHTEVIDQDETHPVTRFVNFSTLELPTARQLKIRPKDVIVVSSTHGPLVIDARDGDRHALVIAFNLLELPLEGAWTFDPSFPIFLSNVIRYLSGSSAEVRKDLLLPTGGIAELPYPKLAAKAQVQHEKAEEPTEIKIVPGDESLRIPNLDRRGIYTVTFQDVDGKELSKTRFAANLVSAAESTVAPADNLVLKGRKEIKAVEEAVETNKDVWKYVAAAALLFVMLEWWIYNRRVYL